VLLEELVLLLRFNPDIIFILQGTGVREFFKKKTDKDVKKIMSKKSSKKQLFSYTSIQIGKKQVLTYIFPHSAGHTASLWEEIKETHVKEEIKNIIEIAQQ